MNAIARICSVFVLGGVLMTGVVMLNHPQVQELAGQNVILADAQEAFDVLDRLMRSAPDGLNRSLPG